MTEKQIELFHLCAEISESHYDESYNGGADMERARWLIESMATKESHDAMVMSSATSRLMLLMDEELPLNRATKH